MNFDKQTEDILRRAVNRSLLMNEMATPEHILYEMTFEEEFSDAFTSLGGSIEELRNDLENYFNDKLPIRKETKSIDKADISAGFSNAMDSAIEVAQKSGNSMVRMIHVLWGIFELQECFATYYVEKQIGNKEELIAALPEYLDNEDSEEDEIGKETWRSFATNLCTDLSTHNPLIGREEELDRAIQILLRKDKNNPLFVGEPGVGKTAMAYGLADRIVSGNVPEELENAQVFLLDLSSLVAGTPYRGEFEKRIKVLMDSFSKENNPIIFMDEVHNLIGAGGLSSNSMDASNILQPYLEDGTIRFIGATTYSEYNKNFTKNQAFARRFQKIDIKEPSESEATLILKGLLKNYEKFHSVKYSKDVPEYAVTLSKRFINDKFLPDKAIDLLDEAGSYAKIHKNELVKTGNRKTIPVGKEIIEKVLSSTAGIPLQTAKNDEVEALSHLYERISSKVFGQNEAVRNIVDCVCMSRSGLNDENKPVASFLFVGPTGVGKTEIAKVLASELGIELVRFDMSEYAEKHSIAKFIGSPAGYVGYEEGGLLTDAIRKTPHCVLLLDEIEKAHPDIFNMLLQVMDYASLTDNKGQKADFKNCIIIMTSNAGAKEIGKQKMGFGEKSFNNDAMMEEVKRVFSPEFRNRLSSIVMFNHMDNAMASLIVEKKLNEFKEKLGKKKVTLNVHNDAYDYIMNNGVTREYGARELERVINTKIKPLLVKELLFGKLKNGGNATLLIKDKEPSIAFDKSIKSTKRKN